jgi:hypothetical protein
MNLRFLCIVLLGVVTIATAQEEVPDPLPRWSEEDAKRVLDGESLISGALFQPVEDDLAAPVLENVDLPDPGDESFNLIDPTEITEEFLPAYFGQKPKSFLIDPQSVLSRQEYRDRLSFLKYHASDSKVGFYVYVFDTMQVIPPFIRVEELFARYFADEGPTVILFYYLGDPSRAEVHLSPDLMRSVGKAERARVLQSSINQAVVKSQPVDQLDGFCVQMSIRIYWMEKALESGLIAPIESDEEPVPVTNRAEMLAAIKRWWLNWRLPVGITAAVVLIGLLFTYLRRRRMTYHFPEFPVAPRLGGKEGAGVGAVITYASARIPPAMQREQVPDFSSR